MLKPQIIFFDAGVGGATACADLLMEHATDFLILSPAVKVSDIERLFAQPNIGSTVVFLSCLDDWKVVNFEALKKAWLALDDRPCVVGKANAVGMDLVLRRLGANWGVVAPVVHWNPDRKRATLAP